MENNEKFKIGVLSVQGDFFEHIQLLESMGVHGVNIRAVDALEGTSGLIIPGGESTVMSSFMARRGIDKKIKELAKTGYPVFGTCAGAIVLSKKIEGEKRFKPLGLIDICVKRNSYGRQVDSFETQVKLTQGKDIKGIFIRAPQITKTGPGVEVLASFEGLPILVKQKNILASTFHPEIAGEKIIHKMFVEEARKFFAKNWS